MITFRRRLRGCRNFPHRRVIERFDGGNIFEPHDAVVIDIFASISPNIVEGTAISLNCGLTTGEQPRLVRSPDKRRLPSCRPLCERQGEWTPGSQRFLQWIPQMNGTLPH